MGPCSGGRPGRRGRSGGCAVVSLCDDEDRSSDEVNLDGDGGGPVAEGFDLVVGESLECLKGLAEGTVALLGAGAKVVLSYLYLALNRFSSFITFLYRL